MVELHDSLMAGVSLDDNDEFRRLKLLLIAVVAFLISGWFSWVELRYQVWGDHAEATVDATNLVERSGRRGRRRTVLDVSFHYVDQSTKQSAAGRFDVSPSSEIAPGDQFEVQYIPGQANSAREGLNIFPVIFFIGSIGFMVWAVVAMAREANQPIAKSRRRA